MTTLLRLDPMPVDRIVDILAPHSLGCHAQDCAACDTAIGQAGEIAVAFRVALLDNETAELICRSIWAGWDCESEEVRCHLRNHWIRHLAIAADALVPVPVAVEAS